MVMQKEKRKRKETVTSEDPEVDGNTSCIKLLKTVTDPYH
jgi:hypothetical protein